MSGFGLVLYAEEDTPIILEDVEDYLGNAVNDAAIKLAVHDENDTLIVGDIAMTNVADKTYSAIVPSAAQVAADVGKTFFVHAVENGSYSMNRRMEARVVWHGEDEHVTYVR